MQVLVLNECVQYYGDMLMSNLDRACESIRGPTCCMNDVDSNSSFVRTATLPDVVSLTLLRMTSIEMFVVHSSSQERAKRKGGGDDGGGGGGCWGGGEET